MPKLLWKDGITTITELTANAKVGIIFTIVVIGLTEDGKYLFEKNIGKQNCIPQYDGMLSDAIILSPV